jgi:hypothetical protein
MKYFDSIKMLHGTAVETIVQVVCGSHLTVEIRVQCQFIRCGIYSRQSVTGASFLPMSLLSVHYCSIIISLQGLAQ